jgi:hypothetical protein
MLRRYLKWRTLTVILLLASLTWSAAALWIEIAAQPFQPGRALLGVAYTLGLAGLVTVTLHRWMTSQRTVPSQTSLLFESRTLTWAAVAALWMMLRVLGRLMTLAFGELTLPPLFGMVLATVLGSILLLGVKRPHQASMTPEEQVQIGSGRIARWLAWLLPAVALLAIATYLIVAAIRLTYPFELEWMEGGSVEQIGRLVAGQPLYVAPSMRFIPYIYTPLYFYLSALIARLIGVSFIPLRLVSIIASLGCLLLIFQIVRRETTSKLDGLLAAGLFAATYPASASWLDLGRADTLALCLLLAAIYTLRFQRGTAGAAMAGGLLALSFLTKQTMLIPTLPLLLFSLIADWRRGVCVGGIAIVTAMLSCLALNVASNGWFAYYIFGLPGQHRLYLPMLYGFLIADMWLPMGIAVVLSVAYLASMLSAQPGEERTSPRGWRGFVNRLARIIFDWNKPQANPASVETHSHLRTGLFYLAMLVGLAGGSWAGKLNDGGFNNALLLAYAAIAIVFGLALHRMRTWVNDLPAARQPAGMTTVLGLCLFQLGGLAYNPLAHIPRQGDVEAGQALVETISRVDGDVFIPFHGYLAVEAGKPAYANGVALGELAGDFGGKELDTGSEVLAEMAQAIREQRFGAVVIDSLPALDKTRLYQVILPLLDEYYQQGPPLITGDADFWPLTGTRSRPDIIYYPRNDD